MPDSHAESADGVILVANGIDPVLRWDGYSEVAEPAGVAPPDPAAVPTLTPTGAGSLAGDYYCFVRFVDSFGNLSDLSSISAVATASFAGSFTYGNLPAPQQAGITRRQVLRNTAGQTDVFYVDIDTADLSSTELVSDQLDADLAAGEAVPLLDSDGLPFADRYGRPPATKPFIAFHLNRMWLAGEAPYAEGSAQVTKFSAAVAGVGTRWPTGFAGRFLYVRGADKEYEIAAVDPVAQTLTLTEAYTGSTDPFAQYTIKPPPGEANLLYFSEPNLPESWPPVNAFSIPEDGEDVTGLCNFGSFLWIFKRKKTYRLTAQTDPRKDGFIFYALGRGCVNHRCWVVVEENLYLLDEGGVYRTGGGDSAEQLSSPIQNLFRRDQPGINWAAARYFHCTYSPAEETIRWFVTLRGSYLPRHALALHYKTGKWWVEEYPRAIGAAVVGRVGRPTGAWIEDNEQLFLGSTAGEILAPSGTLDGVPAAGQTTRGRVTAAGIDTLTDAAARFDAGWANVPVAIASGRGAGQVRLVVAATATTLRVGEPWAVAPDATSVYQVGGIRFRLTAARLRYAPGEVMGGRSVQIMFVPTEAPQTFNLRIFQDFAAAPRRLGRDIDRGQRPGVRGTKRALEYVVDLTRPGGIVWQRLDGHKEMSIDAPHLVRMQLDGVSGPEAVVIGEVVFNGMVK